MSGAGLSGDNFIQSRSQQSQQSQHPSRIIPVEGILQVDSLGTCARRGKSSVSVFSSFLSRYRKMKYEIWKMKNETATQLQRRKRRKTRNFHCDCWQPRKMLIRLEAYTETRLRSPTLFSVSGRRLYMGQVDMPSEPRRLYCNFLLTSTRTEFVYPTWEGVVEF